MAKLARPNPTNKQNDPKREQNMPTTNTMMKPFNLVVLLSVKPSDI